MSAFEAFPKIPRLSREMVVTEKIDGTNAQILITEDGEILTGSRSRWITPENDNFGFARWVQAHRDEVLQLGPGRHFGEWWGQGIQRGYGLKEKRLSLFNVRRWAAHGTEPEVISSGPLGEVRQQVLPECIDLVPVLYRGPFENAGIEACLNLLRRVGSVAAPGFMKPEGVVVFHTAASALFKKTIEGDEQPKSARDAA